MPWGRIDDSLWGHPKLDALGKRRMPALGLHLVAISWCNHWLTDGCLPADRVVKLGGTIRDADALVTAGLWERTTGGYAIHDFLVYNGSRADILARRDADAARKRAGRTTGVRAESTAESGRTRDGVQPESNTESSRSPEVRAPAGRVPRPDPTRPDPTRSDSGSTTTPEAEGWFSPAVEPVEETGAVR